MERTAKTRTGIILYRVEGGTIGSIHRRGPEYYATEQEAQERIASDTYAALHPAAGPGIMLGYEEVELTPWIVSACLKARAAGSHVGATGEQESILRQMNLATPGQWDGSTHPLILTRLGQRVAEMAAGQ